MTASPSQHDYRWMVRAFYSDGSTALYPYATYKRAARANARGILNVTESRFVHSATAGRSEVVATAVVDSWDDDYVPKDADVFLDGDTPHGADASFFQRVPHVQFAPAEALGTALRNAWQRSAPYLRSIGAPNADVLAAEFRATGYGVDPTDGSTTLERAERARRTVKVNPSKVPLTSPENAGERRALGAWIAERAGDDYVTTTEAAHVVTWCREWIAELDSTPFEDGEKISDTDALAFTQRYCEGGMRFVLDDVRRCRDTFAAVAGIEAEARERETLAAKRERWQTERLLADIRNTLPEDKHARTLREAERIADAAAVPFYTRDGAPMTAQQRATVAKLREECERGWCVPVNVTTARYGSGSDILAIVHAEDSPAPDPVVALWLDGSAHAIGSEDDWTRWHDILAERATHAAVQRADDMCVVIAVGGSFAPLP